tara:strand:+ start:4558 stop:4839 length:282 start_codon:yes stop_codon:yes gene_type:complete
MKLPVNYNETPYNKRWQVKKAYIEEQEGLCCHCECSLEEDPPEEISSLLVDESLFPKGFFNNPVHLHHSHATGMTIGVVHAYCNAVLWQYHGE